MRRSLQARDDRPARGINTSKPVDCHVAVTAPLLSLNSRHSYARPPLEAQNTVIFYQNAVDLSGLTTASGCCPYACARGNAEWDISGSIPGQVESGSVPGNTLRSAAAGRPTLPMAPEHKHLLRRCQRCVRVRAQLHAVPHELQRERGLPQSQHHPTHGEPLKLTSAGLDIRRWALHRVDGRPAVQPQRHRESQPGLGAALHRCVNELSAGHVGVSADTGLGRRRIEQCRLDGPEACLALDPGEHCCVWGRSIARGALGRERWGPEHRVPPVQLRWA